MRYCHSIVILLFVFAACTPKIADSTQDNAINVSQMKADVKFLSSDALEGREVGTQGEIIASEYLASRMEYIGLATIEDDYFQHFSVQKRSNPHADPSPDDPVVNGRNVIGMFDNGHANTIVLGAHYDHLGWGPEGSLHTGDPAIHNGADDNASGVAMILELGRKLGQQAMNYNYVIFAFSGEEKGLWGSNYFTENPTFDLDQVNYMMNFDMVGRLEEKKMAIYGTGTSPVWEPILNEKNTYGFQSKMTASGVGPSDHTSFYLEDIPVLQFFTGQHEDYHRPSDDYEKINFEGMEEITEYVWSVIQELDKQAKIEFTKTADEQEQKMDFKVTLGVIPDYLFSGKGMRIDGVRDGKPAAMAGLLKGDIVVKMGDVEVVDMMSYMKALGVFNPGEETEVHVDRDGEMISKTVTWQ